MEHTPLVSIVLPVYNGGAHLNRAIESIISQNYKHWELVIVNDSSTDNSREIALDYTKTDRRIRLIDHEVNKKLPAALNTGFANSNGDFYTWTSHDNEFLPDALQAMSSFLLENPETGLVYADEEKVNENSGEIKVLKKRTVDRIVFGNVIGGCFLYRKQVVEQIGGYDESLFLAEDYDYWLRVWREFKCSHLNKTLYRYYLSNDSLTATQRPGIVKATLQVARKNLVYHNNKELNNEKEILLSWLKYWYKYSFRKGNYRINIMASFLVRLIFRYPIYFFKFLLGKRE